VLVLAPLLHAQTTDVWELLALVGPFTIVFGAGIVLVIMPIVRSQGERYQHREHRVEEDETHRNGNGTKANAETKRHDADQPAVPTRWKN